MVFAHFSLVTDTTADKSKIKIRNYYTRARQPKPIRRGGEGEKKLKIIVRRSRCYGHGTVSGRVARGTTGSAATIFVKLASPGSVGTVGGAAAAVACDVLFWRATRHTHESKLAGRRRAAVPGRGGYARTHTRTFFSYSADLRRGRRDPPRCRGDPKTVDPPERTLPPARAPGFPKATARCYYFFF